VHILKSQAVKFGIIQVDLEKRGRIRRLLGRFHELANIDAPPDFVPRTTRANFLCNRKPVPASWIVNRISCL
jgi:hypothetical protein